MENWEKELQTVLDKHPSLKEQLENGNTTLLHVAAGANLTEAIQALIAKGYDVNLADNNHVTPLMILFTFHHYPQDDITASFDLLVKAGADVTAAYKQHGFYFDIADLAASYGDPAIMDYILKHGGNINSTNQDGMTLLDIAALENNTEMIKYLLAHGLDVNQKDLSGATPLVYLFLTQNTHDISKSFYALMEAGADVNISFRSMIKSSTIGHLATAYGNVELMKYLVEHGLNLYTVNDKGETLLHIACRNGNSEMINYLIEQGMDITAKDNEGNPAYKSMDKWFDGNLSNHYNDEEIIFLDEEGVENTIDKEVYYE
jgi:ankyrin repeat protein